MPHPKTLLLFNYDWDELGAERLKDQWPSTSSGFDLFTFPSNARLAWFDTERFVAKAAVLAKLAGAKAVASSHEQFGALCAAMLAEKMGWPGTPVKAILACQHKLYARQVLEQVAPEANLPFTRLDAAYGGPVPGNIEYPQFVKPVKAAFSVLSRLVKNEHELHAHTRFGAWELWVIKHLVEPFERVAKKRLPEAGTAHSLMLEAPMRGRQYNLDGYVWQGDVRPLGVVDEVMYPNTDAFMRFEYPSKLNAKVQSRAADVARRFLTAVGFSHGLFNMEFFHDEATDKITVIEFNPRMASQFSDLYLRVDGIDLHEVAFALAHGIDPATLGKAKPSAGAAASFVYRSFDPSGAVAFPSFAQKNSFWAEFPEALLFEYPKDEKELRRDFKWLRSYRYGIMHLGGENTRNLRQRCEQASAMLGWTAPYLEDSRDMNMGEQKAPEELFAAQRVSSST
ncbi:ATP-grasp domain-containing protein [Limnobacter parvus]|uniref:ATP-grasp domain-containing protein n=1 Tax=Limnobacter parvus TaxID=2939690 RepID=A0ABT1XEK4_9BURK|nr:ATP-grasp domain-containing protein [Limnobacter parvus]MCR2745702.1 ATP-grasp domain-containing protein [Limnobacter parvus]